MQEKMVQVVECEADDEPPGAGTAVTDFHAAAPPAQDDLAAMQNSPQWESWEWQMGHRIKSVQELLRLFPSLRDDGISEAAATFPLAITPYYASLIRHASAQDPLFRMSVPQPQELYDPPFLKDDPLSEDHDMPVPGLVHRYGDRALLLVTMTCAMYCRYCTRKRVAGARESCIKSSQLAEAIGYLRAHPEIHDVIVSGGDPFTMSTRALETVLKAIREVPSVEIIRIGTRTPVTLPFRITDELTRMLRKYHPIWVNTHFNHPNELTPASVAACTRLADAGVPVGNQSVLLRGVNDDPAVMERLCRGLVRARVRPYYLFQCDLVRGVEHFRTRISRGIEIMEYLRGRLSGLAIPTYTVDCPTGGGKVPVLPNYVVTTSPTHTVLRNFEGMLVSYPEPQCPEDYRVQPKPECSSPGVWELAVGRSASIKPDTRRDYRGPLPHPESE